MSQRGTCLNVAHVSTWHMYQRGTCIGSTLIVFLLSYFLLKMLLVMNKPYSHKNNRHWFGKTSWKLTKII